MYHIIIVDDEQKIREGISHLFPWEQLGFQIIADFGNGKEAWDYVTSGAPVDVVMTDIRMPIMDGIELSEKLLRLNIKVIFFSNYQDFEYAKKALINHVFDYILKPVKYNELADCLERIRNLLDSERHAQTAEAEPLPQSYYGNIIQQTQNYIKEHYRDASLEEAAMRVSLSPSYLSKLFKQKTGENFTDYLMKVRMETACTMLCDPAYKQYQIANLLGYDNPKNFTRAFKSYYQMTPQDYRKQYYNEE